MAKITRNITIDAETWALAKQRTESVSSTIDYLLKRWVETESELYEKSKIEQANHEKELIRIQLDKIQQELEKLKKEKDKNRVLRVIE